MCCLPNQFPLPIFLILNLKLININSAVNYETIKNISENNMFFKFFVISLNDNKSSENNIDNYNENENENRNIIGNYIEKSDKPFYELIDLLMKFKDLKDNILLECSKGNMRTNKNNSKNNNYNDRDRKDKKNCLIL
jgi:hypothetical protein